MFERRVGNQMKILVYDVAAENGGAVSILKQYYKQFVQDSEHEYVFVLSKPLLESKGNVEVVVNPFSKKSWLHRMYFDRYVMPKIVKKLEINVVFSLQNMRIPRVKVPQVVYFHNLLALTDEKFSFWDQRRLWIYKNLIGRMIRRSLKKADHVIVQAEWIKNACVEKIKLSPEVLSVEPPKIELMCASEAGKCTGGKNVLFYPASEAYFKNHRVIVEACRLLKSNDVTDYRVVFTLRGDEDKHISELCQIARRESLPIEFVGMLDKGAMGENYRRSILLFPSYIETIGLPLLEAKQFNCGILCADCEYARAALQGYDSVEFFAPHDSVLLAELMRKKLEELT